MRLLGNIRGRGVVAGGRWQILRTHARLLQIKLLFLFAEVRVGTHSLELSLSGLLCLSDWVLKREVFQGHLDCQYWRFFRVDLVAARNTLLGRILLRRLVLKNF